MDRSQIAIVIPAYNEAKTIVPLIESCHIYATPIVVDDGSSDQTAQLALSAGAIVVSHQRNQGYDAALNTGFQKASEIEKQVVITMDADGQHNPQLIVQLLEELKRGFDVVIGVRDKKQRFGEHLFAFYTQFAFGIRDPLCGMKAYRIEVYRDLGHFDSYQSIGTELMVFAAKNGFRVSEFEIRTQARQDKARFSVGVLGNYRICRALIKTLLP